MTHHPNRRQMLLAGAGALAASQVFAQEAAWPNRPIKVLVPSGPSSATDMASRALCERLRQVLKQPLMVENRPGASGAIATMAMIRSAPDGYTFLLSNASSTVMAEALVPKLPFSTLRDMQPVALTAVGGVMLVTHPDVPARTLPELVQLLKSQPDRYPSYGSWAVGSNGHLTMEWIKQRTGIKISHVPYRTVSQLLPDIVSGVIPIAWTDLVSPVSFIQQGRLRAIAVNGEMRSPKLPEVQTMTEQGFPFPATGWQGLFAPKGTPTAIVQRMHEEINRILVQPDFQSTMRQLNLDATPAWSRERFEAMLGSDLKVWQQIVTEGNIKMDI